MYVCVCVCVLRFYSCIITDDRATSETLNGKGKKIRSIDVGCDTRLRRNKEEEKKEKRKIKNKEKK